MAAAGVKRCAEPVAAPDTAVCVVSLCSSVVCGRVWYRGRAGERVVRPLGTNPETRRWLSDDCDRVGGDQTIGVAKVAWYGQAAVWLVSRAARLGCAVAACGWQCKGGSRWLVLPSLGRHRVGSVRAGSAMVVKTWAVGRGGSRHGETHKA